MQRPSDEYLLLATTLLDALPHDEGVSDQALLQLHQVFGPMLIAALQLVEEKDVVKNELPGGRHFYQVSSTAGGSYSIHANLPPRLEPAVAHSAREDLEVDAPSHTSAVPDDTEDGVLMASQISRVQQIKQDASALRGLYCPCAGFAYNSLAGDQNLLCKHLLAILIAEKMGSVWHNSPSADALPALLRLRAAQASFNAPQPAVAPESPTLEPAPHPLDDELVLHILPSLRS